MSTIKAKAFQHPSATSNNITFNADGTHTVNSIHPTTSKNLLINGGMNVWQYSTANTPITTDGYYTADRWETYFGAGSLGTWFQLQSTDVPSAQGFGYSLKMDCSTADTSPGAADQLVLEQKIEGQNLQHLLKGTSSAKALTLSFWVKSNKTGTYIVSLIDSDNVRHISRAYTIDSASTWEKKTLTFDGDTTGAFDNNSFTSLTVKFFLGAGSNVSSGTLATSWESYITDASNRAVGQVNLADSTSNEWYITGIQLEVGEQATGFEFEPYETVHNKCLRYCVKDVFAYAGTMGGGSANIPLSIVQFPVRMRISPTVTWVTGGTVSDGQYDSTILSQNSTQSSNPFSCRVLFNRNTTGTPSVVGRGCDIRGVTMKYDAEL